MGNRDPRLPYLWMLALISILWAAQQSLVAFKYIAMVYSDFDQLVALMESSSALVLGLFASSALLMAISVARCGSKPWYFTGLALNILSLLAQGLFIYLVVIFGEVLFFSYPLQLATSLVQLLLIPSLLFISRAKPPRFMSVLSISTASVYIALVTVLLVMFFLSGQIDASYLDLYYSRELVWIMLLPLSLSASLFAKRQAREPVGDAKGTIERFMKSVHPERSGDEAALPDGQGTQVES